MKESTKLWTELQSIGRFPSGLWLGKIRKRLRNYNQDHHTKFCWPFHLLFLCLCWNTCKWRNYWKLRHILLDIFLYKVIFEGEHRYSILQKDSVSESIFSKAWLTTLPFWGSVTARSLVTDYSDMECVSTCDLTWLCRSLSQMGVSLNWM